MMESKLSNSSSIGLKKLRLGKKRLKDYGKVLLAKQLLRAIYNNPREKVFKSYFLNSSGTTNSMNSVFEKLNSRLDTVLTAMGGALSNKHAKQLISHGKVTINGHIIKESGYLLNDGDIIASSAGLGFKQNNDTFLQETVSNVNDFRSSIRERPSKGHQTKQQSLVNREPALQIASRLGTTISLKVASLKPKKIPSYLNLHTPVFATLIVNSKLGYGVYYSNKVNLNSFATELGSAALSDAFVQQLTEKAGLGWKNTNLRSIKSLLVELKLAQMKASVVTNLLPVGNIPSPQAKLELGSQSLAESSTVAVTNKLNKPKAIAGHISNSFTTGASERYATEKIKKIYSVLYSLVQAYYSRQH